MMMDEYKGWSYEVTEDTSDRDCRKYTHWAIVIEGSREIRKVMDYSPYDKMTFSVFQAMVDLGFPARENGSPLNAQRLISLLYQRGFVCPR